MDTITIHLLRSESTFDFDYLRLVLDTNKPFLSKNNTKKAALLSVVSVLVHRISKRLVSSWRRRYQSITSPCFRANTVLTVRNNSHPSTNTRHGTNQRHHNRKHHHQRWLLHSHQNLPTIRQQTTTTSSSSLLHPRRHLRTQRRLLPPDHRYCSLWIVWFGGGDCFVSLWCCGTAWEWCYHEGFEGCGGVCEGWWRWDVGGWCWCSFWIGW